MPRLAFIAFLCQAVTTGACVATQKSNLRSWKEQGVLLADSSQLASQTLLHEVLVNGVGASRLSQT